MDPSVQLFLRWRGTLEEMARRSRVKFDEGIDLRRKVGGKLLAEVELTRTLIRDYNCFVEFVPNSVSWDATWCPLKGITASV